MIGYLALFGVVIFLILIVSCSYVLRGHMRKKPARHRQSHHHYPGSAEGYVPAPKTLVRDLIRPLHIIAGSTIAVIMAGMQVVTLVVDRAAADTTEFWHRFSNVHEAY